MKVTSIYEKLHTAESDEGYDPSEEQFDLIAELAADYFGENYCEKLVDNAPSNFDADKVAMYFSMLGWQSHESCLLTSKSIESWLQGGNEKRLNVALSKEIEWFPFKELEKMKIVLNQIKKIFPKFSKRCDELIESRLKHEKVTRS